MNRRWITVAFWGIIAGVCATGAPILEQVGGAGNTLGTAQAILGSDLTLPLPGNVFLGSGPTATISGGLQSSGDIDIYSLFLLVPSALNFDIDDGAIDMVLTLFNSSGTVIGFNDDATDPDPFIGTLFVDGGTYYIAVTQSANYALGQSGATFSGLVRPDGLFGGDAVTGATPGNSAFGANVLEDAAGGSAYTLHISALATPEPSTLSLLGLGGGLAMLARKKFRRQA